MQQLHHIELIGRCHTGQYIAFLLFLSPPISKCLHLCVSIMQHQCLLYISAFNHQARTPAGSASFCSCICTGMFSPDQHDNLSMRCQHVFRTSSCPNYIQQEQAVLTLMACMWTALQTAHCSLSTIFFVVLAFLWNTGFV